MASRGVIFSILSILIAGMILMTGCGSDKVAQQAGVSAGDGSTGEQAEGTQADQTGSSGCTSPYDGTYSGTVSGSGERESYIDGETVKTPYIITYNLEITLKCFDRQKDVFGGEDMGWDFYITHAKASDPFFDCENGCTLVNSDGFIPEDGQRGGGLYIEFPNGANIYPVHLQGSDGKIISTDQLNSGDAITASYLGNGKTDSIETRMFPNSVINQEGFTMRLNKIS